MKKQIKWGVSYLLILSIFCGLSIDFTTVQAATKLVETTIISVKETSNATVTLKWKKKSSVKGYQIYRKTGKNGKYYKIATIKKNSTTTYVDKSTKDNKEYYYAIRTYKGKNKSTYSTPKKIKTSAAPKLGIVDISSVGAIAGKKTNIVLTAKIANYCRVKPKSVKAKLEKTVIGTLNDDGKNGDKKKGDGIFSCTISVKGNIGEVKKYSINLACQKSKELNISFFDELTKEDFEYQEKLNNEICELVEPLGNSISSVNAVYQKACELKSDGKVLYVEKNKYGVTMQLESGIWYSYEPEIEGVEAGLGDVQLTVKTLQPYNYSGEKGLPSILIDQAALTVNKMSNCIFTKENNIDNDEVTLDKINDFSKNQVIIWHGHGGYSEALGPCILTGENPGAYYNTYKEDFLSGGLIASGKRVKITSIYVQNHLKELDHSIVYLGCCLGAKDSRLISSFLAAGAETVLAFNENVLTNYDQGAILYIFSKLATINPETGCYFTVDEAVKAMVKEDYPLGPYSQYTDDNNVIHTAYLRVFGNKDYKLSNKSVLKLSLDKAMDTIHVGDTTKVKLKVEGATQPKIKWEVQDSSIATLKVSDDGFTVILKAKNSGTTGLICTSDSERVEFTLHVLDNHLKDGIYIAGFTGKKEKGHLYKATYSNGKIFIYGGLNRCNNFDELIPIEHFDYGKYEVEVDFKNHFTKYFDPETYTVKTQKLSENETKESFKYFNSFWSDFNNANGLDFLLIIKNGKVVCVEGWS